LLFASCSAERTLEVQNFFEEAKTEGL
jgi:hypothetical protein